MRRLAVFVLAALMLATALPGIAARSVHANGVPQLVKLTYLEGVSNWGPENAEGVLEFSFAEAYAKVDVKNLVPQAGYTYDGWLTAADGASLFVGEIPVDANGLGQFDVSLSNLDRYDYSVFVITARPAGGEVPAAVPAERSIAGRFTVLDDNGGTAGQEGDIRPALLPETGERAPSAFEANAGRVLYVAGVMAVSVAAVCIIRRIQRGRSA